MLSSHIIIGIINNSIKRLVKGIHVDIKILQKFLWRINSRVLNCERWLPKSGWTNVVWKQYKDNSNTFTRQEEISIKCAKKKKNSSP